MVTSGFSRFLALLAVPTTPLRSVTFVAILLGTVAVTHAQWADVPPSGIPRTPDGTPNLSAAAPRLPNGGT